VEGSRYLVPYHAASGSSHETFSIAGSGTAGYWQKSSALKKNSLPGDMPSRAAAHENGPQHPQSLMRRRGICSAAAYGRHNTEKCSYQAGRPRKIYPLPCSIKPCHPDRWPSDPERSRRGVRPSGRIPISCPVPCRIREFSRDIFHRWFRNCGTVPRIRGTRKVPPGDMPSRAAAHESGL
jgi:hypothetical protein